MRNYFKFGNFDSRDFGVYITRDGVYNAQPRLYDAISVPGRNGDLLFSRNRMDNIEVRYPCLIYRAFDSNLSDFRNALISVNGYAQIEDSYHPDEFRLGYLVDGFDVDPRVLGDGGTFELVFNCKPQRFLKSGNTPVTFTPQNYIPYPYEGSTSGSGITWSVNDRYISASGQAGSTGAFYYIAQNVTFPGFEHGKQYTAIGTVGWVRLAIVRTYNGVATTFIDYIGDGAVFMHYAGATYTIYITVPADRIVGHTVYPRIFDAEAMKITNPTLFDSNPLIRIEGLDERGGTVSIGGQIITVNSGNIFEYIDIDSETQNCYSGTHNANALVNFRNGDFPKIKPGTSNILCDSWISDVQITPRWYRV